MRIKILFLLCFLILSISDLYSQTCTSEKGYNDFPFTQNGLTVSASGTGGYMSYGGAYTSCGVSTKGNSVYIGMSASTFTSTFSQPVNDMIYNVTGAGDGEVVTITVNSGTPTIKYIAGDCPSAMIISDNKFTMAPGTNNHGGRIKITSTSNYTSITFSHNGAAGGLLMTMCFDAVFSSISGATVTTSSVSSITANTATGGGDITDDGGAAITAKGICWNTGGSPTISDSHTDDGSGLGEFTSTISGLAPNTTYYVSAYGTNSLNTSYGNVVSFKTLSDCTNPSSGGTISPNQSICPGTTPAGLTSSTFPTGQTGTLEYKWQVSTTSSSSGFVDILNSNAATYNPGSLTVTAWYKRLSHVTCMDWSDAAESNVLEIKVNTPPDLPSAATNSYSYDGTLKIASALVGANETVDWYTNATGGTTISAPSGISAGNYSAYAESRNLVTGCVSESRKLITLKVTKAMLTVNVNAKTKTYGADNPELTFDYSGWQNGEGETVLTTKPSATTTVTITSPVAVYTNAITASGGGDENYDFTYVPANMEITKAMLTVTADIKTKVYADSNPLLTFHYNGWVNTEDESVLTVQPTVSTIVNLQTGAGTHSGAITVFGGIDENYDFTYVAADFIITKAVLTITSDARIKHYDEPVPPFTFKYSGWKNGENISDLVVGPTMTSTVTIATPVGKYPNSIIGTGGNDKNYDFLFIGADFEVIKTNQEIKFADLPQKTYGDPEFNLFAETNSGLMVSFTSSNPSVATVSGNMVSIVGAGTTTITAIQEGTNNFNAAPSVPKSLVIKPKVLTVENAIASSKVYDGNAVATIEGAVLSGVINSDDVIINNLTGSFTQANVGKGIQVLSTMTLSGEKADNYELIQPVGLNADIQKMNIKVTANIHSKTCSEIDPTLTYEYNPALIGLDSFTGTLTREAENGDGIYSILQGSLALSSNYNLMYQGAEFTITDGAPIWITPAIELNRILEYNDVAGLAIAQELVPEAFDACENNLPQPVKISGEYINNSDCDHIGSYINTWTVTDHSGNVSNVYTQTISLIDTTIPTVENLPSIVVTVPPDACETKVNYPEIKVLNDCIAKIELISGLGKDGLFPIGTTMEKWALTDISGNTAIIYFAVTVITYNQAPKIAQIDTLTIPKYTKEFEVLLSGINPTSGCRLQEIESITAEAENKTLIPAVLVNYSKGESTGKLILKIADKVEGETIIHVTVKDNGGVENAGSDTRVMSFTVKIEQPAGIQNLIPKFDVKVYPNPSSGVVNIETSRIVNPMVKIFNSTGIEVYNSTGPVDFPLIIDLSKNVPGMYIVEISNDKSSIVKKLVLKR